MIFSVGVQFQNNIIHTLNIKALSFNHAEKKIDDYCHQLNKKYGNTDYYYKRCAIAGNTSGKFDPDYPLVKISRYTHSGDAVVNTHNHEIINIL